MRMLGAISTEAKAKKIYIVFVVCCDKEAKGRLNVAFPEFKKNNIVAIVSALFSRRRSICEKIGLACEKGRQEKDQRDQAWAAVERAGACVPIDKKNYEKQTTKFTSNNWPCKAVLFRHFLQRKALQISETHVCYGLLLWSSTKTHMNSNTNNEINNERNSTEKRNHQTTKKSCANRQRWIFLFFVSFWSRNGAWCVKR